MGKREGMNRTLGREERKCFPCQRELNVRDSAILLPGVCREKRNAYMDALRGPQTETANVPRAESGLLR